MKKKPIIIIPIIAILIMLFFIFFFSSGIKGYNSKLSNTLIYLPKSSFNIREYQDDDTYTIMWYTLRDNDSIRKDIEKINSTNHINYTITDWGYNNEGEIIKEYFILYEVN